MLVQESIQFGKAHSWKKIANTNLGKLPLFAERQTFKTRLEFSSPLFSSTFLEKQQQKIAEGKFFSQQTQNAKCQTHFMYQREPLNSKFSKILKLHQFLATLLRACVDVFQFEKIGFGRRW